MDGLIILDKPAGITSARAVGSVKRLLPRGTKIGHAGTLDPFATGVLVLLVGGATRLCERIMSMPKTYDATIKLGATTATDDTESPEAVFGQALPPSRALIERTLQRFVGAIQQRPPVYSAIKIAGRRACDHARRGSTVNLQPRTIHVHSMNLVAYDWPLLRLRIECGRGTYIRSIARDLGEALKVGGYLTELRRARIGAFDVAQAVRPDGLSRQNIAEHLRPIDR